MNNVEIKKMYDADQGARLNAPRFDDPGFEKYARNLFKEDKVRHKRAKEIIEEESDLDGEDYYHLAMLFQHSDLEIHNAVKYAKKSMDMGYENAKWLYAAAVDRQLTFKGKKQKYGTQFKILKDGTIEPLPMRDDISDEERGRYNVPPIEQKIEELKKKYIKD
ncbi:MAG: hypothetical protein COT88_02190 [Candidatus Colwellbacteria bacterium CG10_big_fil_rev_8_21_14_0_10_41_28]|uniref:Uncharacterized protein n=1 Tax=Candidatus Colwellbacteria bacterium CG10_big_fil_rev_8_21_14_0_10_41_28 TaxID=1974539 RepID=A0A2H0VGV4_9BACT|nr:MAG: hypothetical protein COT88_02190 [Candidatus Colwellbacteria bacterium CG10_big_fil_rev_8_21_14_0_10_41_28]